MTDDQRLAIATLERELLILAKGATGLAELLGGRVDVTERPEVPARFADMAELDLRLRLERVEAALDGLRQAFRPAPLRLVD